MLLLELARKGLMSPNLQSDSDVGGEWPGIVSGAILCCAGPLRQPEPYVGCRHVTSFSQLLELKINGAVHILLRHMSSFATYVITM